MARVYTAAACLGHPGFPEQPERLRAVDALLRHDGRFPPHEAAPVDATVLESVHPARFLSHLAASAAHGTDAGDECPLAPASWSAILAATGATFAALDHGLTHGAAFAAIRPPGHHAAAERAAGFCAVNQAVLALARARAAGVDRALLVDWDVHHGDGTQALVCADARTRFVSMHQWPWYPGTGAADDRGVGNCTNLPMPAGLSPATYRESLWQGIVAATTDWRPDLVLVSAGFDSLAGDPLGGFTLEPEDMAIWASRLRERWPDAPVVAVMEGGYAPDRLAAGVLATVAGLAGEQVAAPPS